MFVKHILPLFHAIQQRDQPAAIAIAIVTTVATVAIATIVATEAIATTVATEAIATTTVAIAITVVIITKVMHRE